MKKDVEVVQHQRAQSFYGGTRKIQVREVKVRTIHDNKMRIERSRDRASQRRRRERKSYGGKGISCPQKAGWNDNESKRKRRVVKYNLHETEEKLKSSLKGGIHSFKITCMKVVASFN